MTENIIFKIKSIYRDDFCVRGFSFGSGEKALAVAGSMRGNEYQQLYIGSQLTGRLEALEAAGMFSPGSEVLVIPCVNPASMNIGKRFWAADNTDINRMFPGYSLGETTQRIAAGVFDVLNKYKNGIQFASFYMPGEFSPHVNIMKTGFENVEKAASFGLPYIELRTVRPYETTTLNYNWQIWETDAYSLYSARTRRLDKESAETVLRGIINFMTVNGMLRAEATDYYAANLDLRLDGGAALDRSPRIFCDDELVSIRTECSGLYDGMVRADSHVTAGQVCAVITDPMTGRRIESLEAPCDGVIFFQHTDPLVYAHTAAVKLLPDS